ncbi:16S rRNA pseudouridine(516) synthase, partial [Burkholderia pseudomallei]
SRRQSRALGEAGHDAVGGAPCAAAPASFDTTQLVCEVDGVAWPYRARACVALAKPAGYVCSREPQPHSSVVALVPPLF